MRTANQIKSEFETLASGHYQIHSFLYAQEFEQQAYENLIYPLMLVYPLGGGLQDTTYTRNYRVIIADRVLKSEGNELEVESDTQLICLDILAYWKKLGQNERFTISSSETITPFWEKWGDEVTGHFVDIGIEMFYDFNSCAIPMVGTNPSPINPCKDARISVNSIVYGNAPSDTNFNVVVKDQEGTLIGSLIGGEWIVNTGGSCDDATYTIEDTLGNVLYSGIIPSGGNLNETIDDSTLNVNKSDGSLISSRSILAEGTDSYNVSDSVAVIKDSANNTLKTQNIKATETENIPISDSVAVIKNSLGTTLKTENILAEDTENITINNSTLNVQKSDGSLISARTILAESTDSYNVGDSNVRNTDTTYSVSVKATEDLVLPDSQINVNGVDEGDVVSVKAVNVILEDSLGDPVTPTNVVLVGNDLTIEVASGITPSGILLDFPYLQQYTSYRTGDEGDRVQNGWNDYTAPTNPKVIAQLDTTLGANMYFRLKENSVVDGISSKIRFVDVDGGQTFSATGNKNLVCIDKLTGLMFTRTDLGASVNWNNNIDNALAHSIVVDGVTYDDWYLISMPEALKLFNSAFKSNQTDPISSVAIVAWANAITHTSSTTPDSTGFSNAARFDTANGLTITQYNKTSNGRQVYVRKCINLITAP